MVLDVDFNPLANGRLIDNLANTTLVNNTTATRNITVPTNRRWFWFGGRAYNADNVARTISYDIFETGGTQILPITTRASVGASTALTAPENSGGQYNLSPVGMVPLKAGDVIKIVWITGGASAGGTATSSAIVIEVPV